MGRERVVVSRSAPIIEIDRRIGPSPYKIRFDPHASAHVFESVGMPKENSEDLKVRFTNRIRMGLAAGEYIPWSYRVSIDSEFFWKQREKNIERGKNIQNGNVSPISKLLGTDKFVGMRSGKRLARYLKIAPKDRGFRVLEKLADKAMQREVNSAFHHESKHAADYTNPIKGFLITFSTRIPIIIGANYLFTQFKEIQDGLVRFGLISLVNLLVYYWAYQLGLDEIRARRFAERIEHDPSLRPIKIVPKRA